jgi:hypothetical protein
MIDLAELQMASDKEIADSIRLAAGIEEDAPMSKAAHDKAARLIRAVQYVVNRRSEEDQKVTDWYLDESMVTPRYLDERLTPYEPYWPSDATTRIRLTAEAAKSNPYKEGETAALTFAAPDGSRVTIHRRVLKVSEDGRTIHLG